MSDREHFARELARYAVLTPHAAKLGLPEAAEVTSLYMLDIPWEDWDREETRHEGSTVTLMLAYLINGEADFQLMPFVKAFDGEEALSKNDLIIQILLDKIGGGS